LQEAVLALKAFQQQTWPPSAREASSDNAATSENHLSAAEDNNPRNTAATLNNKELQYNIDDPQTREHIHEAVRITLNALILVLQDPAKLPRPSELALDGITLLVAHRYVSGRTGSSTVTAPNEEKEEEEAETPDASLLTRLLDNIAKMSDSPHEAVQTALLSTMTTIMTCTKCSIHENSMLTVVRCTYHVYLVTKSTTLKDSAKRALLDIIKAVFFRMEAYDAVCPGGMSDTSATGTSSDSSIGGVVVVDKKTADVEEEEGGAGTSDRSPPPSPSSSSFPKFASQYHADAFYLFRSLCKLSSKELPADMTDEMLTKAKPGRLLFPSALPTDPTELNSKILSLELILIILEQYVGDAFVFHRNTKFIYLIQHYLCGSLLKNCISNHTQVAFLSQKIFLVLVYKFKSHLKQDIEVFMSNVFFRVLESSNTSFKQKALVLESLRSLCKDPILLTQIFLTYDCDFDAMNLYKDIVHMLTKLGGKATTSMPTALSSKKDMEQEFELSLAAIECLVTILKAFLRALNLPSGDDSDIDTAGARIRSMIQLDSALACMATPPDDAAQKLDSDADSVSVVTTEDGGPSTAAGVVNSDVAVKIVDAFDRKRNAEQNFQIGVVKFTLSLKNGLHFFIEHGFVELHAKQIALFFINHKDKLDKTQMGEALGREPDAALVKEKEVEADLGGPGFWVRILHHYTEALDFSGLVFDEAIRLFLSGFRLPGEAQKIDRIMEKFAERYTSQNPAIFPSSDTAFILGFSVIMLNTDLHNPSIKPEKRMTIDSFLRNNRGIGDNGSDLPDDVLKGIFERIKDRPFSLKEDDAARERVGAQKHIFDTSLFFEGTSSLFGASAEDRKRENFKKERDEMMAVTEQLIRRRPDKNSNVAKPEKETNFNDDISPAEVVKPMFDVTWGPMLGILSQVLECADDERSVAVCLNGFVFAIRLAAHSQMSLVRDTFVSSMAKFTFLGSIKEMKRKNVESIRTLLSVAIIDGEHLGESWLPVLQCMSQLARLRLSASGLDSDESFLMVENPKSTSNLRPDATLSNIFRQSTPGDIAREAEESNGKAVLEAVHEILIDKVFSSTVNLSAKSLALFVEQLIAVSSTEIAGSSKAVIAGVEAAKIFPLDRSQHGSGLSIFSLQRLVDVADYNMDIRPRLVWAQVWDLMAEFFVSVARHENGMVSIFAIDSLKQLSLKFLEKPELSEFNFQCTFLKPFLIVMEDKTSRDGIRELILQCIDNIIRAKSHNLKSGWKVMFSILTLSASDPVEKIEYLGLAILQRVLDDHLDDIFCTTERNRDDDALQELSSLDKRNRNTHADDFVSLCKASLSFLQIEETDSLRPFGLSMRAFCHIAIYADLIASRRVLPPVTGAQVSLHEFFFAL
jgi:brefeldin A-inhibited guanine nucleotide-exchange protein